MVERWCCAGKCANPDPGDPRDMLGPLDLKTIGVRDVGIYTCLQQVLLRNVIEYNVTASTVIQGKKNISG